VIILDTNVLSALMQQAPDEVVTGWLDSQPSESVWTTAVTVFEIQFGLALLPGSKRRRQLERAFAALIEEDLEGKVLAFDDTAARAAGEIAAREQRQGRTIEIRDVQIAAITAVRRASLATRNTRHFQGAGIELFNPWAR